MSENPLIKNLQNTAIYNHSVKNFKLLETHISWVILTGQYAYKIKKPVDFEFLNYSTLEKRKYYCEEEIRLNQFLAPELYCEVVKITGNLANPQINGSGAAIEYAVKMREFSQDNLFSELQKRQQLDTNLIEKLALQIAAFHLKTPVAEKDSVYGTPQHVHAPVVQNFDQILPLLTEVSDKQQLDRLQTWSEAQFKQHQGLLQQRKDQGFIRDCHGDLHLGNIIVFNQKPLLFDRIEFNEDFRWTDVIADIAFLAMDLEEHKEFELAKTLLNTYFDTTGDYQGLTILPYYQAYRAIVRAKISLFHAQQTNLTVRERQALLQKYRAFIQLAESYTKTSQPILIITHGFTGSGKSTIARSLVDKLGAYHVRSDVVRKRLLGLTADAKTNSRVNQDAYKAEITQKTYDQLKAIAQQILTAGYSAIIDASFLKQQQRNDFMQLAAALQMPLLILSCEASRAQIEAWLQQRQVHGQDPSEGRIEVLNMQQEMNEPLTTQEKAHALVVNAGSAISEKNYVVNDRVIQEAIAAINTKITGK